MSADEIQDHLEAITSNFSDEEQVQILKSQLPENLNLHEAIMGIDALSLRFIYSREKLVNIIAANLDKFLPPLQLTGEQKEEISIQHHEAQIADIVNGGHHEAEAVTSEEINESLAVDCFEETIRKYFTDEKTTPILCDDCLINHHIKQRIDG